ncbi:MAG: bis-aminopropyl spermidine synthase family protein [Myxococcales bacterium]|nr:bis-aminopropyl spermidine synthase family protein [Myxococcales bacterium]
METQTEQVALTDQESPMSSSESPWSLPEPPSHLAWAQTLPPTHPRRRIRNFLYQLFEMLGEELPEAWPKIPAEELGPLLGTLRAHLQPLYNYVESQQKLILEQRYLPRYLGETALYLMRLDWLYPEERHAPVPDIEALLADRPPAIIDFDQLYCAPETSKRRADRIRESFDSPVCKVLMLGDDDLISVVLAQDFRGEVHMVDLDDRLHEYIAQKDPSIHRHKADFIYSGMPKEMHQQYDAVVLDPPWDAYRMGCFLEKAMYCLKDDLDARIYMSYCPLVLEFHEKKLEQLQTRVARLGFTFERIETAFNLYDLKPETLPDFQTRLERWMPPIESPLLDFLRRLPFAHSHLYTLRRLPFDRPNWLKRKIFTWWNQA